MSEEIVVPTAMPARQVRAARPEARRQTEPRVEATGVRRVAHVAVALAGWVLFAYWWRIVLQGVSRREVEFSAIFLVIALIVIVATTGFWVIHNLALFRRKGARLQPPAQAPEPTNDALGRPLHFDGGLPALREAGFVRVVVEGDDKQYRAGRS